MDKPMLEPPEAGFITRGKVIRGFPLLRKVNKSLIVFVIFIQQAILRRVKPAETQKPYAKQSYPWPARLPLALSRYKEYPSPLK